MANWITEVRGVIGGMIKDLLKRNIPKNKFWESENIALSPNNQDSLNGASVQLGSEFAFGLNEIDATDVGNSYKYFRVPLDLTAPNITHSFTITYGSPTVTLSFSISSAALTPATRYSNLISLLNASTTPINGAVFQNATPSGTTVFIGFRVNVDAQIRLSIAGVGTPVIILKEYLANNGGAFRELKSLNIEENIFVLSTNGSVLQLSVGKKDYLTGTWTNKILFQTNQIQVPIGTPIDMDGQIDFGERLSIYFTTDTTPRCIYVPYKNVWNDFASMIWYYDPNTNLMVNNTDGYYIYNSIESETSLQLLQNFARVSNAAVSTGGALKTGNKQYYIRQISGNEVKTGIGMGSGQVSIFQESLTNPALYGNVAGLDTNKKATLTIENLDAALYDKFELICTENNGGVFTSYIVNVFNITGETMTVTHFGNETQVSVSQSEFAQEQVLLKTAKNLVIARNRLFLSNVTTQIDYDLSAWAQTIGVTLVREGFSTAYSDVFSNSWIPNEYQETDNIFQKTGYTYYETYRFGIKLYFTNGFVSRPYYIDDFKMETNADNVSALTSGDGTYASVFQVYLFRPQFLVNLDTAPTIDGKSLKDVLYGYEIVRLECIPEVLATGFTMPSTYAASPMASPPPSYCRAGGRIMERAETGVAPITSFLDRKANAFYSPEVIFGTSEISPSPNDKLVIYGQPVLTDYISTSPIANTAGNPPSPTFSTQICGAMCFTDWAKTNPYEINISYGEILDFNSNGNVVITPSLGGLTMSTVVASNVYLPLASGNWGNNQKCLSLRTSSDVTAPTFTDIDFGFYYSAYYRPQPNKYGDIEQGNYIACGYFRKLSVGVGGTYTDNVYGGDTFTQRSYIKFCNMYVPNDYTSPSLYRVGLTFWTQNRANFQLRNFDLTTSKDFPYTTNSNTITGEIAQWLGLDQLNAGQTLYDISNSPLQIPTASRVAFNPNDTLDKTEQNILYYSDLKVNDSLSDPYRMFMPLNRKSYPAMYGGIQNTFVKDSNSLIIMMDNQVYLQALDQQQNQTNSDGTNIIIGDGSVVGARELALSQIGSPLKTAAIQYKTSSGRIHVSYFNPYLKKLIRIGEGITDIGETTGVQSFLTNNTDRCFDENSLIFGYNFVNDELYTTAVNSLPSSTLWNNSTTYNTGDIVYLPTLTNPSQQFVYYKAKISVPVNKNPTNLVNQISYWELIRESNFTLVYNDKLGMTTGFKGIYPMRYLPFNETYLTAYLTQNPLTGLFLTRFAEHNKGILEYGSNEIIAFVRYYFNDVADYYKIARLLYMDVNESPIFVSVRTENNDNADFSTYSQEPEINYIRPHWATAIRNDATVSLDNPNGLPDINTAQMAGQLIEVTIYFKNTNAEMINVLKNISLRSIIKPKLFNI